MSREMIAKPLYPNKEQNSGMEQVLISGSSDGWNQYLHKKTKTVLQLNSAGHFKRRRRLRHKC